MGGFFMKDKLLETRVLSSLSKVFADEDLRVEEWNRGSMLLNEVYSFQVAYRWNGGLQKGNSVKIISELAPWIQVRAVGLVPSEMPCYSDHDENVLRTAPGLYPDILEEIQPGELVLIPNQWRSLWVTVKGDKRIEAGEYDISIVFADKPGEELAKAQFALRVLEESLPEQVLIHTEWFHSDCLATYYNVEVFSEGYWKLVERYVKTAVDHGINMLLTPVFTPPLDTAIGGERLTVQLVDVIKNDRNYTFEFGKLKRWIELCREIGIRYFEISHLFTQWGARHAPKIMALEDGVLKKIFGWETEASGEEYESFLGQFLKSLAEFLRDNSMEDCCYFHVSDEPSLESLEDYSKASMILNRYVKGFPVIDALSSYDFYEKGLVKNPIPSSDHIEKFLERNAPDLWTYYCCAQGREVSNRFMNMPSARNRIIGMQLYKFNIKGFLHWGYNFWHSQYSVHPIDPYRVTDAELAFPSGDAFLVYPGKEGPVESIRLEVFNEALQDLRALRFLEKKMGRDEVIKLIEEDLDEPITFKSYPKNEKWLLLKREQINKLLVI
jgi:hypothetical protein